MTTRQKLLVARLAMTDQDLTDIQNRLESVKAQVPLALEDEWDRKVQELALHHELARLTIRRRQLEIMQQA